ncbi:MAG: hypothetical protein J0L53_00195 [Spirochaetes bacterium]|nr:hypothetical protein [Spirochaetota bacterium]
MRRLILLIFLATSSAHAADKAHEMERYRQIASKSSVTVQDMVDLLLMARGEFEKYHDEAKRFEHARSEGWVRHGSPVTALDRGTLAFALMMNYNITRGWLFRLTRFNRYALRDVQEAGILSPRFSEGNLVSGAQLIGAISAAEDYKTEKEEWPSRH